ncbi:PASTA domain-containing protein [Actinokineospora sp. NBRC 105648]|uniref:PASTA domain-containing protein n=1 Tax=Actinokineospora sp. NBRC 105648 TaxID=3032206 RepID=UPI0024A38F52|nr:PASTA domain-containing protein [Actinokineospora sp. NBRC 105648]GLZ43630.1 hypothetical protein Acsp05_72540 [Actinokineospora sp. NBRC 105648]
MTPQADAGWAFLVARGRVAGYRLLLVPDFVLRGGHSGALIAAVGEHVPRRGRPGVRTIDGVGSVVYRTRPVTLADIGADVEVPLLDAAGRPIVLTYGFVCRATVVGHVAEVDIERAWQSAVEVYQRFHAAELTFHPEASAFYRLVSSVAGHAADDVHSGPNTPSDGAVVARSRFWGGAVLRAGVFAVAVLAAGLLVNQIVRDDPIRVPSLVGRPVAEARQDVARLHLTTRISYLPSSGTCPKGVVHSQVPDAGVDVEKVREVILRVCARSVVVPNLVGRTLAEARRMLTDLGLVPSDGDLQYGVVIATVPKAGSEVFEGDAVQLVDTPPVRTPRHCSPCAV